MTISRGWYARMVIAGLGIILLTSAGCAKKSPEVEAPKPPPPQLPTATPAPPPPAPLPRGARIADETKLQGLIQGKTTKADVREMFGIPQEIVYSPAYETFIYYREKTTGWISRASARVEMLTIRFDPNGVLKDFEYRYSGQ